jgi:hypothetical protein
MKTNINLFGKDFNLYVGIKLFVAGLILLLATLAAKPVALTLLIMAGFWLHLPFRAAFNQRVNQLTYEGDGDEDEDPEAEAKAVLKKFRIQTEKILEKRGFVSKTDMEKELNKRMAAASLLNKDELALLKTWMDESKPEGVRSILKKQGEDIQAMSERMKTGEKKVGGVRALLKEKMPDIKKIFESGQGEVKLNTRAAVVMTLGNTTTGDDDLPEEIIESFSIGAFVEKRQAREYVFDLANRRTVSEISQFKTWLEEGDEQGGFAIVAEGGLKPLVSTSLVRNHSEYRKIAAKQVFTEEFAKFRKESYNIIKRLIQQKLLRDYAGILTTSLLADAAPYVSSALDDQYANPTDYHAIGAVAAQIEALNFAPDMLILNPQDKWRIGLSQDLQGQFYLQIPLTDPNGQTRMMGFMLRTSNKVPVGNFLLGESGLWEVEDEPLTIRIGMGVTVVGGVSNGGGNVTDVQSDMDHNRFRIIVETFFHDYIATNNEGSFVYGNFDTIKALLASE